MSAAEDWLEGGQRATMLITSSLQYPDATDPAYVTEACSLLAGMDQCQMAITMAWLARAAGSAILDKHQGSREGAEAELQQLALVIAEAQELHAGFTD